MCEIMPVMCPSCAKGQLKPWFTKTNSHGSFPVCVCKTCRSGFVWPRPPETTIVNYYECLHDGVLSVEERYKAALESERLHPNGSIDAARVVSLCKQLAPGKRFLDVGAGMGHFSKAAHHVGFQVAAIEPSEVARGVFHLMTGGLTAQSGMLDAAFTNAHVEEFDVVLLSQVLEHVLDVPTTVQYLHRLLAPNGIACIAIPLRGSWSSSVLGRHDIHIIPPEHLNFFTRIGLVSLFERYGFKLENSHTVSRFDPRRAINKFPIPMLGRLAMPLLQLFLRISDYADKGIFLNAYFRKRMDQVNN